MRIVFLLFSCLIFSDGFGQLTINDPHAEVRTVTTFHSIKVSGAVNLILTGGDVQTVVVSDRRKGRNEYIKTVVDNGVLKIYVETPGGINLGRSDFRAYVSYTTLKELTASGATDISFSDDLSQEEFSVKASGASVIKGNVKLARLEVNLSGASEAKLGGTTDELKLLSTGASDLKSYALNVMKCEATLSGASDARLTVQDYLKVTASGASSFYYKGSPKIEVNASGSSTVRRTN